MKSSRAVDMIGWAHDGPMTSTPGHLFLVHGRIESVVHDAAIIPTSDTFDFRSYWTPILGNRQDRWRPKKWPGPGYGRAAGRGDLWFVSVGARTVLTPEALTERVLAVLQEVAEAKLQPHRNRVKPLVAVPVFGIEGGGHGENRGELIRRLLTALNDAVQKFHLDIVLVTPEASVYAAAQHVRRQSPPTSLEGATLDKAELLGRRARRKELALFLGAGVSIPAGLPSWDELIELLVKGSSVLRDVDLSRLTALDQAQLLERRLPDHALGKRVAEIIRRFQRPSLAHALLAGLGCREAVTTNYDKLYEMAVDATGRKAATILPWHTAVGSDSWVLKMHGDIEKPETIVLTRQHFIRFDATTRPAGSMLQSLLLTRHLLLVGASLKDDNVVRLAYEVQAYREKHGLGDELGTLIDVDRDLPRSELWRDQLAWLDMSGETLEERSRSLEVFLDTVARLASDDASWLLDDRFASLLLDKERDLADQAMTLYRRLLQGASSPWHQLSAKLESLGASAGVESKGDEK